MPGMCAAECGHLRDARGCRHVGKTGGEERRDGESDKVRCFHRHLRLRTHTLEKSAP